MEKRSSRNKRLNEFIKIFLNNEVNSLSNSGVKLSILGDLSQFDNDIKKNILKARTFNQKNFKINLIMAINYGARQEITRAAKEICKKF